MACTHTEALYGGHNCRHWIHLEWTHLDTPGMDPPGPTWMTCTHLDGLKSLDTPTWEVGTHLEALNTGAIEPLMDSSRQLPWISVIHDLTGKEVFWKAIELTGTLTWGPMPVPYHIALENVEPRYPWSVMGSHAVAGTFSYGVPLVPLAYPWSQSKVALSLCHPCLSRSLTVKSIDP